MGGVELTEIGLELGGWCSGHLRLRWDDCRDPRQSPKIQMNESVGVHEGS